MWWEAGHGMIVAFARYPVPPKVKTRLAAGVGAEKAAELYDLLLTGVLHQMARCTGAISTVACADTADCLSMQEWLATASVAAECWGQDQSPDLGHRMAAAIAQGLQQGAQKVCVVGTDVPELSHPIMERALSLLDQYEVVLGPSMDGGFYLVGSSRAQPGLMKDVHWSCGTTRAEVRHRAQSLDISIAPDDALPCLMDIDTLQDLQVWHASAPQSCNPEAHALAGQLLHVHGLLLDRGACPSPA